MSWEKEAMEQALTEAGLRVDAAHSNPSEGLSFDEYEAHAAKTAIYPPQAATIYPVLGLASEAGEVAALVKRVMRDGQPLDVEELKQEVGDCLWYLARICSDSKANVAEGFTLAEAAAANVAKLADRAKRDVLKGEGGDR